MPEQEPSQDRHRKTNEHLMTVTLFAPLRLAPDLNRRTERVIKAHSNDRVHFTEITISESRNPGNTNLVVTYIVKAFSPRSAQRVGAVYLSQLCDLLSAVTQCPVRFFMNDDDAREERGRMFRQSMRVDRTLSYEE